MRHHSQSRRLGVKTGHRVALLRNLLKALVRDGSIRTTVARAKVLRPFVEKLVTRLREPTVANVRHVSSQINDRQALNGLMQEIAPKFKTRNGGYIRILKMATRRPGDNADMAIVQWVDESLVEKALERRQAPAVKASKTKETKKASKKESKKAVTDGTSEEKAEKKTKKASAKKTTKKSA